MIFVFKCRPGPLTGLARSGGLAVYYLIRIGGVYLVVRARCGHRADRVLVFKCRHGPLTGLARSGGLAVYYLIRIGGVYLVVRARCGHRAYIVVAILV